MSLLGDLFWVTRGILSRYVLGRMLTAAEHTKLYILGIQGVFRGTGQNVISNRAHYKVHSGYPGPFRGTRQNAKSSNITKRSIIRGI